MKASLILLGAVLAILFPAIAHGAMGSGFDCPVGKPNASGYYDAQGFGGSNDMFSGYHLGEDWNKNCAGDCDLGDPVYSISDGTVDQVSFLHTWGNVVTVIHQGGDRNYKSLYAHLQTVDVVQGQKVGIGQEIGTIGKGDGNRFAAHLHFELRDDVSIGIGTGYGALRPKGWVDPTDFINAHRPPKSSTLTVTPGVGVANVSWTKSDDPQYDHSEVYRSSTSGGTADPASRVLVVSTKESGTLSAVDDKVPIGTSYYRITSYFKNGLTAESAEVSVEIPRQITQATTGTGYQGSPTIVNGKVFYEDTTPSGGTYNKSLYYYDLGTKQLESVNIPINMTYSYQPQGSDQKIAYYSSDRYGCYRVFYYDFAASESLPVSIGDSSCTQMNPDISSSSVVVWEQRGIDGLYKIYLNDTNGAGGPTQVSNYGSDQMNPRISGDNLIWKDSRNSKSYDIYLKNLTSGTETMLAADTGDGSADIWGEYAVWEYKGKVTMMNIDTKEQKIITPSGAGYNPTINEGKVAYTLLEAGKSYVHVYDIQTGDDAKIDVALHLMSYPSYGNGYIAWDDNIGTIPGNKDIFLTKL